MKLKLSLLAAALGVAYMVLKQYLPDFPVSEEVLLSFVVYVLLKLGVEVSEARVASVLERARLRLFGKG